jgi:hypothetical protein
MCTIIVTIRAVLWYVMSLAGTLMILVAMFTNKWLEGKVGVTNLSSAEGILDTMSGMVTDVTDGDFNVLGRSAGLFLKCKEPEGTKFFEGECIPDLNNVATLFTDLDDTKYPHAWRGAVICFTIGLGLMVITDLFALLTICCRRCLCCSVFTVCGSVQSFAGLLFTLGLVAYPAGWGADVVNKNYCAGQSGPFMLGESCQIGPAFWLAVAGTVCTCIASSLAIWAYQSTKSSRCEQRQDEGEKCICLP